MLSVMHRRTAFAAPVPVFWEVAAVTFAVQLEACVAMKDAIRDTVQ